MDLYTKAVFTVIAGCLLVLVGTQMNFPSTAHAAGAASSGDFKGMVGVSETKDGYVYFLFQPSSGNKPRIYSCKNGHCEDETIF